MKSLKQTQSGTSPEKTPGNRLIPILSILLLLIPLMAEGQKKEVDAGEFKNDSRISGDGFFSGSAILNQGDTGKKIL